MTTHIFKDFEEFNKNRTFTALCGANATNVNYLSVREIVGAPRVDMNEVNLSQEDRARFLKDLCPDCANSEEFAMLVLAL